MNFLAHLYLSGGREPLIIGNFLADYLKNRQVALLPEPVRQGVWLHRRIDSFTDQHPEVRKSVQRLRPKHGKYSPVILDVCHDYILVRNWQLYSEIELEEFTAGIYAVLRKNIGLMPDFLQSRLPFMIADDWLVNYGTETGLKFTFNKMKLRTSFPRYFDQAFTSLMEDYSKYESEFNNFFPDVISTVNRWINENIEETG